MSILNRPWETMGGFCQDPLTVATVAFTAFGKIQEGRAAKSAADFNAKVAQRNADISKQQTQVRKERHDKERRLRAGANIASAGASGAGIESFGDILSDNAMQEELDLLTIESEGLLQKQNFEIEASQQKAAGKNAMMSGIIGAGTSILGSGAFGGGSGSSSAPIPQRKPMVRPLKGTY